MPVIINNVNQYIDGLDCWLLFRDLFQNQDTDAGTFRSLNSRETNEDWQLNEDIITKFLKKLIYILQCRANVPLDYRQAHLVTLKGEVQRLVDYTEVSRNIDELVLLLRQAIDDSYQAIDRCKFPIGSTEYDKYMLMTWE